MLLNILFIVVLVVVLVPPIVILRLLYLSRKPQHSIIRQHPILGWMRYLLEKLGPEFRQYWFDDDSSGKPFSRNDFIGLVFSAKYRSDLLSFGSKRDMDRSGYYIANAMFPLLTDELYVDNAEYVQAKKYVIHHEGIFSRRESLVTDETPKWLYQDDEALIVGGDREQPWVLKGMFGASATSYGSVGENYILSTGHGAALAGGSWLNTGEGGVVEEHLATGADVVAQIGPGMFGYRDEQGRFSMDEFRKKAEEPHIKAFELKFAQGAKIRGGHLEGSKVSEKIAAVRKVAVGKTINSPNRFPFLKQADDALDFIAMLQQEGGKPVGIKIVIGQQTQLNELFEAMIRTDIFPDFITVDGGEGGSGATYKAMADSMGLPLFPALLTLVDTAHAYGVRDRFKIFASGKLIAPDKVAIALAIGADGVNSARGFMMANGCIMAAQCHTGKCPAGVTTTDPEHQNALVVDEKKWRVMNYIVSMRFGLYTLAAACGLDSPRKFGRDHILYKDEQGRVTKLSDLFPVPTPQLVREREHQIIG